MKENNFCYKYPHPAAATDCVVFGFDGTKIQVLLILRNEDPKEWALPGGFIRGSEEENADECAVRELEEETGFKNAKPIQFHTFTDFNRDPREWVISIAYYALALKTEVKADTDAKEAKWFNLDEIPQLAFDHNKILNMAIEVLRRDIYFHPIGFDLLPEVFTMSELQTLYEAILDKKFDRRNFYKKMIKLDLLTEAEPRKEDTPRRIATKYRFNKEKYDELKQNGYKLEF